MTHLPPLAGSIVDVIGHTPMVELSRLVAALGLSGRIVAKLENLNPGLSKKDRIARSIIEQARAAGELRPGQTVVELTSGNTGTGLAIVCRALGHPFIAVMSRGNTPERARMMQALGAQVELVDQAPGSPANQVSGQDLQLVEQRTRDLVEAHQAFRADQFTRQANVLAHERTTGPEIWRQTAGRVDAFVDFVGTGGSFTGVARYLRQLKPECRCYVTEPAGARVLAGEPVTRPNHVIQGGGYAMDLPLLERELITDYLCVTDEQAMTGARLLAEHEGIFAGFSAGANLAAAAELLKGCEAGNTVAILVCDSGLKYLSTSLFPAR